MNNLSVNHWVVTELQCLLILCDNGKIISHGFLKCISKLKRLCGIPSLCMCKHSLFGHVWLFATSMDCSLPGSSVHGTIQARILDRVAMPTSRGSSQPRDWTRISCISCTADSSSLSHQGNLVHMAGLFNKQAFDYQLPAHTYSHSHADSFII